MPEQLTFDLAHRPALDREDFLVADSNRDAVAWIDRWPDWPLGIIALHGPAGCGKTHLAHVWQSAAEARLIAAEQLTIASVPSLAAAPLAIDNADRVGEPQALLHMINLIRERGHSLLLTGSEAPARWVTGLPDLASRLAALPAAAIAAPDDALIGGVLVKLFADRQLRVGRDVIAYLLSHMERSFGAVHRLVAALDDAALASHRNVSVGLARETLARLNPSAQEELNWS